MACITKDEKTAIIAKFARSEGDTGSPEVQIAVLTEQINILTAHLKTHIHDNHSRRGLAMLIGERKAFLKYLENRDINAYRQLKKELGIR